MKLVHKATGKPVEVGEKIRDFRGDEATVTGWVEPHKAGSTGRIRVSEGKQIESSYFPSVFDCEWREESQS